MIQTIKRMVMSLSALAVLAVPALVPATVSAQSNAVQGGLKCGAELDVSKITSSTPADCDVNATDPGAKVNDIIKLIINIFSLVVGVVAVIMIIIGGLKYITSGGDSGNVTGAKNTILYAIIGLVVVALAQFIVRFVLSKVTA